MFPKYHILFGFILVVLLYFFFPQISLFGLLIIFLSSFLIDVDHVLFYFIKTKDWNPFNAHKWYVEKWEKLKNIPREQRKNYSEFYLFHGIEWLIIFLLLGIYLSKFFTYLFIGFSLHLSIDLIHEYYYKETIDKSSSIWNFIKWKKSLS